MLKKSSQHEGLLVRTGLLFLILMGTLAFFEAPEKFSGTKILPTLTTEPVPTTIPTTQLSLKPTPVPEPTCNLEVGIPTRIDMLTKPTRSPVKAVLIMTSTGARLNEFMHKTNSEFPMDVKIIAHSGANSDRVEQSAMEQIKTGNKDLVIVHEEANPLIGGKDPLIAANDALSSLDRLKAIASTKGVQLAITTVLPIANPGIAAREAKYNRLIMEKAPQRGVAAINISDGFINTKDCTIKTWHLPDGVHGSDEGMESVFGALLPVMASLN